MNSFLLFLSACVLSFEGYCQTVYPINVISTRENAIENADTWTLIFENCEVSIEYSKEFPFTLARASPPVAGLPFSPAATQKYKVEANNLGCLNC